MVFLGFPMFGLGFRIVLVWFSLIVQWFSDGFPVVLFGSMLFSLFSLVSSWFPASQRDSLPASRFLNVFFFVFSEGLLIVLLGFRVWFSYGLKPFEASKF